MKKYQIILADPPWAYRVWSKKGAGRSAESHYPTMSMDDIRNLPVRELADKNCILFMWVTFPTLREAFSVIDAWGFTYKTVAFAWVKQNKKTSSLFWGMGYWTRANVELCLLATKGSPKRHSANVHQVVFAPIAEHSKKPDIIREKIVDIGRKCDDATRIKIYSYIAVCGLLWSNWCEYKRKLGVEFGEYSLRQYRYAKEYYRIVQKALKE